MAKIKFNDALKNMLHSCYAIAYEKYDGKLALSRIDTDSDVAFTISDSDLLIINNRPAVKISYSNMSEVITGIVLQYNKVLPENNYYADKVYCYHNTFTTQDGTGLSNFEYLDSNGNWQYYSSLLTTGKQLRTTENIITINADGVRDKATAEKLAKAIILQRWKPMAELELECCYTILKAEIGDQIRTDINIIDLLGLNDKTWFVSGVSINTTIDRSPSIKIKIVEIGSLSVNAPEEWQNTYSTGNEYQDTYSNGQVKIGVY